MTARSSRRRAAAPPPRSAFSLHGSPEATPAQGRVLTFLAWGVAAMLVAALLYMVTGPHRIGDNFAETDFYGAYAEGARLVQQGRLVPSRYGVVGPGYEVTLGLVGFVIRDLFLAAELISVAATAGTLLLWFYLLRRRLGARVGFVVTLFLAANPYFFRHGYGAMTDALAISFQAAALYLLLARQSARAMAAAGALAAFAFLTRYNAVYLLPAGLVAILGGATLSTGRRRSALLFAAGFLAPVLPWVLYSVAHGGAFSFQLHHNIAYDVFARARGIPWDDYQRDLQPQFKSLWDVIARDPGAVTRRMLFNVWDHLRQDGVSLLGWPTALAAVLGLALGMRDGALKRLWPLGVAGALLFGTLVPAFYSERYSLALLPYYATLAAIFFASPLFAVALGRGSRVWLKPALVVLPLVAALSESRRLQLRVIDQLPVEVLECGETLKQLRNPGDRIIARKWHIAYHGDVEPLPFPFAKTLPELADYARESRARWLYFSWPEAETRPQFFYLLDTTAVVPGLTPRRVTRPHPAVLYEIGLDFGTIPGWLSNDTLVAWHNTYARTMVDADPELFYKLGGIAWTRGRLTEARQALEFAVTLDPSKIEALLLLGNVLVLQRDAPRARTIYQRAEALLPGNLEARLGLGWASLIAGDYRTAGLLWRPLISLTQNPGTLERMVALYEMLEDRAAEAEARTVLARLRSAE